MTTRREMAPGRSSGFTLLELILVVALLAIMTTMAIPVLFNSRASANETSAIASLRTIVSVNEQYRVRFLAYAASFGDLAGAGFIDSTLGSGLKAGYTFTYSGGASSYAVNADPQNPGQTGNRYFYTDTSGVLRFSDAGVASSASAPVDG